jgi:hypothetical protein
MFPPKIASAAMNAGVFDDKPARGRLPVADEEREEKDGVWKESADVRISTEEPPLTSLSTGEN